MGELRAQAERARASTSQQCRSTPDALAGLIALVDKGTISGSIAKDVFEKMFASGRSARRRSSRAEGLAQIDDEARDRAAIVRQVLERNADAVAQYRAGKQQTFGFLVGQVMKATRRQGQSRSASTSCSSARWKRSNDRATSWSDW